MEHYTALFVGELEFSDLPINSDSYLGMLAYVFFLTFIFLIVVVLMNLLNGLAVNDTSDIKQKAEIYSYISRVETISYMESVLLGKLSTEFCDNFHDIQRRHTISSP